MRITQGTFSYLPDFSDDEIKEQVQYCLDNGWPVSVEYTDDPHPRNVYWNMYGQPLFDMKDAAAILQEINECRTTFPNYYIRVNGYDASYGRQTTALSFIVQRPANEAGFTLTRQEGADRSLRYTTYPYALDKPAGQRYTNNSH
jgi:ribulose-bisphosphate carboxylase small chain